MSEGLEFEESEAKQLEEVLTIPIMADRRRFVRDAIGLRAGESVLSIGCGPGVEPAGLAGRVGTDGRVYAVDVSSTILDLARRRLAGRESVWLGRADATALPVADGAVDAAVSVQVCEYLEDVPKALAEIRRVLRPGGRAAVYATDWDSTVWHSSDSERMERVLAAFEDHCGHPNLGSRLAAPLRAAGLGVSRVEPFTLFSTDMAADAYASYMLPIVRDYVADHPDVGPAVADAWAEDLRAVEAVGETFCSVTQYCYVVHNPG